MAGNPFINSIAKQNRQGDPRFGRFGAGGSSSQGQYQAQPNYSSEPQQYGQQTYGAPPKSAKNGKGMGSTVGGAGGGAQQKSGKVQIT